MSQITWLTWPWSRARLLVSFSFPNTISCFIQWAPELGESGCRQTRPSKKQEYISYRLCYYVNQSFLFSVYFTSLQRHYMHVPAVLPSIFLSSKILIIWQCNVLNTRPCVFLLVRVKRIFIWNNILYFEQYFIFILYRILMNTLS